MTEILNCPDLSKSKTIEELQYTEIKHNEFRVLVIFRFVVLTERGEEENEYSFDFRNDYKNPDLKPAAVWKIINDHIINATIHNNIIDILNDGERIFVRYIPKIRVVRRVVGLIVKDEMIDCPNLRAE